MKGTSKATTSWWGRAAAFIAAAVFALALSAIALPAQQAWAASITINSSDTTGGTDETTRTAYKVLDATTTTSTDDEGHTTIDHAAYSIASNSPWLSMLWDTENDKAAEGQTWLKVTATQGASSYVVTLADGVENNEATAKALASYLSQHIPDDAAKVTLESGAATNVDDGYYLVQSSLGSVLVLATTDISVNEKNDYPSLTKTVDKASLQTGDNATYTITVTVPSTATVGKTITVHDTLDSPLIYQKDVEATLGGETVVLTSATTEIGETWAQSFEITQAMLGNDVVLTYTAELPSNAQADTSYQNKAYLHYSDYTTKPVRTTVQTFDFNLTKSFANSDNEDSSLKAYFQLRTTATNENTAIKFVKDSTGYVIADSDDGNQDTSFIAVDDKKLNIRGLAEGTYYLVETSTADGYNPLTSEITVKVASDGEVKLTVDGSEYTNDVNVENQQGATLPSTGDIGTTVFYVIGGILVVAAAVILIARRKSER